MTKDNNKSSGIPSNKGNNHKPTSEQGRTNGSNSVGSSGNSNAKVSSFVHTVQKLEKGLDIIGKAAAVARMINDPKWYGADKVPGRVSQLMELTRNEQISPVYDPYQLTIRTEFSDPSGSQLAVMKLHNTHGATGAFREYVDRIFQKFETDARYTCPFTRQDIGKYILDCKNAMIRFAKLIHAVQVTNFNPAGDSAIQGELWAAILNNGMPLSSILADISINRERLTSELTQFAQFMRHNVCYDAPIMSKLFLDGTVLYADSPQSWANLVHIVDLLWTNSVDDNIDYGLAQPDEKTWTSIGDYIAECARFRDSWPAINSTIAAKFDQMKLSNFININIEGFLKSEPLRLFDPEVNAQLRNAVVFGAVINGMMSGGSYKNPYAMSISGTGDKSLMLAANSLDPEYQEQFVSAGRIARDTVALYTRVGGNHLTMLQDDTSVKYGIVSTDDWALDSDLKIASALNLVPETFMAASIYNHTDIRRSGVQIPYELSRFRLTTPGNAVVKSYLDSLYHTIPVTDIYPYKQAGNLALRAQYGTNWLNLPIYDVFAMVYDNSSQDVEFTSTSDETNLECLTGSVNTMYQKLYVVTAAQLHTIKFRQEYSLHMISGVQE